MNQAQTYVDQLATSDEWPDPDLLDSILEQGEAAVEPLLNIVCQGVDDQASVELFCKACLLLGRLGAKPAIPELVKLFYGYQDDLLEDVSQALIQIGEEIVEPVLQVACDASVPSYVRGLASETAIEASAQNASLREHVAATLRGILADYVARAEDLSGDEMEMATSIVLDLLILVDPQAQALIDAAFQAGIIDQYVIGPRQVADTYRRGSDVPRAPRDWLEQYRRDYRDHVASERRLERDARIPQPRPAPLQEGKKRKLGRNDPCWCGSGIKYKRCHMREDLGRA